MLLLKKMVAVIIWFARIRIVKLNFVGYVLDLGNHMVLAGIIVTVMMKRKLKWLGMHKKNPDQLYRDIYFIAIDI